MGESLDVLGLGFASVDELLYVSAYPAADAKTQVRRWERHCGGLTATALVAAARMGARCAYAGAVGEDELSQFVLGRLRQEGIDVSHVLRRADAQPVHAVVIVDETQHTRAILYEALTAAEATPDWPPEELIRSARVLFVDHCGVAGMIRAAQIARQAGIPVVADLENESHPRFAELLALCDHLILSRLCAERVTGRTDPAAAVAELWASAPRRAAVVTCGDEGCWYIAAETQPSARHQPALAVEVIDTTGCGDVFHGAYAAAIARGQDVPAAIGFATAAAALKATRRGGQEGIPSLAAVTAMLRERGVARG